MSAADEIKDKLLNIILSVQPQIVPVAPAPPVTGVAEGQLRESLFEFFSAANPPAGVITPFGVATFGASATASEATEVQIFDYGSGDADDIIDKDANEVVTDLFVKTCAPLKGYVLLDFSVEKLFRKCERYTLMKSRVNDFQMQNQGEHLANIIALTEDEFEFFGEDFLYNAAIAVHNVIGAYGRNIGVRSMVFNLGTVDSMGTIIYAIKVPETGFFHNYVLQLYENIESALYYSVLQQWAQWCNDAGEVQANGLKYATKSEAVMSFGNIGCPRSRRPTRFY
jgi:hypothetical protein